MWEQREGRVRLPDGRWVQYLDIGPPTAPVVLCCHGIPGSRQEIGWAAPVLAGSGVPVRLLAWNRPGYGGSAWALDAATVLEGLGVYRCAVLGASGGAPFALAFAAAYERAGLLPRASVSIWPRHGHFSWATSDDVAEVAAHLTR